MARRTVEDVMTKTVAVVRDSAPFKEIVRLMDEYRVSALPVVDAAGRIVGIVSEADLLLKEESVDRAEEEAPLFERRHRRVERAKAAGLVACELMTSDPITIGPDATLPEAARRMHQHGIKRLPVVDAEGHVLGIVSRRDLLKVFLRPDEAIAREVRVDVIERTLWIEPGAIQVRVHDGVVDLRGQVERRSLVPVVVGLVRGIEGVVGVEDHLTFEVDDTGVESPTGWILGSATPAR